MSAYALPGLFPPIDAATGAEEKKDVSPSGDKDENYDSGDNVQESLLFEKNVPLHHESVNDNNNYSNWCEDGEAFSSSTTNIGCLLNSAAIAVKEAKIDPVRWIQYVTGSSPQQYANQIGKTLRRRVSGNSGSSQASAAGRKQSVRGRSDHPGGLSPGLGLNNSSNNNSKGPQNEAIEFELAITFNGRRYAAKRTMQCIMQLRDDLIREMKRKRQWLTRTQAPPQSRTTPVQLSRNGTTNSSLRNRSHLSDDTADTKQEPENKHYYAVQIPEIPPFNGSDDRDTGFVGRGFTMLHAMVTSYVPVMESWFKNVMEIVPQDSECLMNFLWEPATDFPSTNCKSVLDTINNNSFTGASNKFKSSPSLTTLCSIKEMDHDTDGDDSEDEDVGFLADGWK
mmetsp:Transcript_28721/g.67457  ORF Transcript_28721/g.67457 Transcript_28721/m.67457 type:complete len:395 (-) Transcript_28721:2192-3376(-)